MSRTKFFAFTTILLVSVAAVSVWQWRSIERLKGDNAHLRDLVKQNEKLAQENARLQKGQLDTGELDRLHREQSELLKLRNEVAQLRKQLKEASARQAGLRTASTNTNQTTVSPIDTFTATVRAAVAPRQTLITGGWSLTPGKHAFALVTPAFLEPSETTPDAPAQVNLQTILIEAPDETLAAIGLNKLIVDGKESGAQKVISAEELATLLKTMESAEGVNILSAPRITTLAGREAEVKVTHPTEINGVSHDIGPSIRISPRLSADGTSFDLSLLAKMRRPAATIP
ncbi:MAG: polymerase, sigma-24 subunit, subfamily [Verrucomicrobiales bacterium]|nr:polymerase, sigma-24 subunit, subfamily [Verrucomicrobiales bacterium]